MLRIASCRPLAYNPPALLSTDGGPGRNRNRGERIPMKPEQFPPEQTNFIARLLVRLVAAVASGAGGIVVALVVPEFPLVPLPL